MDCVKNGHNPRKAVDKWTGGMRPEFGESADPAYRLALRGVEEALDETFFTLADRVLAPLLDTLVDARLGLGRSATDWRASGPGGHRQGGGDPGTRVLG